MKRRSHRFSKDESGAVTADYVILAGAIIALGLAAMNAIRMGTFDTGKEISDAVRSTSCVTTSDAGTTDLTNCN